MTQFYIYFYFIFLSHGLFHIYVLYFVYSIYIHRVLDSNRLLLQMYLWLLICLREKEEVQRGKEKLWDGRDFVLPYVPSRTLRPTVCVYVFFSNKSSNIYLFFGLFVYVPFSVEWRKILMCKHYSHMTLKIFFILILFMFVLCVGFSGIFPIIFDFGFMFYLIIFWETRKLCENMSLLFPHWMMTYMEMWMLECIYLLHRSYIYKCA